MNWHHGIDSATIEEMKINWYSHRVLKIKEPIMANLFEHIPLEDLVYLKRVYGTDNLVWETPIGPPNEANLEIYRLREDWGPKPEFSQCPNCGNSDVVSEVCDYPLDQETLRFYLRICDECELGMVSSDSQEDADRKWNAMARKLAKGTEQ